MDKESIIRFLVALGSEEEHIIYDEDRRWIRCRCPLAPWTHAKGTDSSPSFGITIRDQDDEGESVANCKTCGSYWNGKDFWHIEELIHKFWLVTGQYPKAASYEFTHGRKSDEHESINIKIKPEVKDDIPLYPLPTRILNKYPIIQHKIGIMEAINVMEYLSVQRGLPSWVYNYFGIRYNADNNSMLFPLTGVDGKIYTLRERLCDVSQKKIWTVNSKTSGFTDVVFSTTTKSGALFGLAQLDKTKRTVSICEGEIDAMKLFLYGAVNPLAAATNQITTAQCKAIHPYIDRIIHFPDAEHSGVVTVKKLLSFFGKTAIKIQVADCGIVKVPIDDYSTKLKNAKDPGDLRSQEQLNTILENLITPEEFIKKYD